MPSSNFGGYDVRKPWRLKGWVRIVIVLAVLAFVAYRGWQNQQRPADRPVEPTTVNVDVPGAMTPEMMPAEDPPEADDPPESDLGRPPAAGQTIVGNQTIYDLDGQVVFRGDVELGPTLARIRAGDRLRLANDGATFQNREGRLPKKPSGYYKEYVHPTPGLSGPGPQRVVVGDKGETYYTPDHYRTFQRVGGP